MAEFTEIGIFQRLESSGDFQYHNLHTNIIYSTRPHSNPALTSSLQVFIEPDEDEKLRTKSETITKIDENLKIYLQEYLLSTMYEENGIGIASIQCGIPLRVFIVDLPLVQSINGVECEKNNPRYVREAVSRGLKLKVIETRPKYQNNECHSIIIEKFHGVDESKVQSGEETVDEIVMIQRNPMFIINPTIDTFSTETIVIAEGCLSVPTNYVLTNLGITDTSVLRPLSLHITYTNLNNEQETLEVNGSLGEHEKWLSRCIQHEYDHLNGVLYTDRLFHKAF